MNKKKIHTKQIEILNDWMVMKIHSILNQLIVIAYLI